MTSLQEFKDLCLQHGIEQSKVDAFFTTVEKNLKDKRYGLVWEEQMESVAEELKKKFPVLKEVTEREIRLDKDGKTNVLIEGDNLESLTFLKNSGQKVDVIYIDPPYNTGNKDFVYNDRFVDKEDSWRHSSWLSFMNKRLQLARELLSDDGVIFISIDEYEFAQLKLLCDSVFGEINFVENFIWIKNSTKNNSNTTSTNHEYIFCYAKNINKVKEVKDFFRVKKNGYDSIMLLMDNMKRLGYSVVKAEEELRKYLKLNKNLKGISDYKYVDKDYNVFAIANSSSPNGNGPKYEVIHPITGKVCKTPSPGWRYTEDTMRKHLKNNRIYFGIDETTVPRFKRFLIEVENEVQKSLLEDNTDGKKELMQIFNGNSPFNNPKPTTLLKTLFMGIPKDDAIILDFFAGSGTTGHAVLELNKEDGGNRQFILYTNNENNIAEEVTYERLKRVMNGYTTPKGKVVDGIPANLKYFKVENIDTDKDIISLEDEIVENIVPFVQFKENLWNTSVDTENNLVYLDNLVTIYTSNYEPPTEEALNSLIVGEKLYIHEGWVDYLDGDIIRKYQIVPIPKEFFNFKTSEVLV